MSAVKIRPLSVKSRPSTELANHGPGRKITMPPRMRIWGRGMECEKRHDVRRDECGPHAVAFFSLDIDTVSVDEHHHEPEVLAHVVPRTPGDINGEQPRDQPVKHMCCN